VVHCQTKHAGEKPKHGKRRFSNIAALGDRPEERTAMKIQIFTMGGTIDKIYFDDLSDYVVGEPQVPVVLEESLVNLEYRVEEIVRKDSLHLNDDDRALLCEKIRTCPAEHILITHGTDSMVQTAQALRPIDDKVIVITGSLSPFRFKHSDAPFNIGCAIGALQALSKGIYIAMSGRLFLADNVRKNRAANRFEPLSTELSSQ
jgi:L-asparaginase